MTPKYTFTDSEEFNCNIGKFFNVLNPETTHDFSNIIGYVVSINGELYKVLKVDRFAHCAPWYEGSRISLLVEACK